MSEPKPKKVNVEKHQMTKMERLVRIVSITMIVIMVASLVLSAIYALGYIQ